MMMATATTTTTTSSSKVCVNAKCCSTSSPNWKPGWLMRSGRIADLCDSCGLAYEQLRFCETFHSDDAGWRTCNSCKKRVHCGCIASIYSFILLDTGGVECINCAKSSSGPGTAPDSNKNFLSPTGLPHKISDSSVEGWSRSRLPWTVDSGTWLPFPIPWLPSTTQTGAPHWGQLPETYRPVESDRVAENSTGEMTSAADSNKAEDSNDKIQGGSTKVEKSVSGHTVSTKLVDGKKQEEDITKADTLDGDAKDLTDSGSGKELLSQGGSTQKMDESAVQDMGILDRQAKPMLENVGELDESTSLPASKGADSDTDQLEQSTGACLTMSLGLFPSKEVANEVNEQAGLNTPISFTGNTGLEGRDHVKLSGLSSIRHRQRQLLPKPPQSQPPARSETPKESASQAPIRVARPPGEGRGRNQLLPRYWPRITDQELQQITSGDSNSTITPLFEKMLSASDAGRIGRLVLPKACAEAYFPPISQPEGLPLRIQDVSGKEWVFQFRFWPNNNSRMYVLEGVTPCIQSMQLQAGDTVTFSRLDPEGKLVMGYRRAPSSLSSQENQPSPAGTASTAATSLTSGGIDSLSVIANLSGLLPPSLKCGSEAQLSGLSGQFNMSETGYGWFKNEKTGNKPKEGSFLHSLISVDKRRGRHLGTKSKRLRMEVEDSIELELSWEEAQDLLRPPPDVAPSIVTIEGHEFEEYEEPPVFGKRTIFTTRQTGPGEDQWAQCDDCGSWRKVPSDVFLPTRWTCADNVWDTRRTSCTSPQEVNSQEIENLLRVTKDVKKPESIEGPKVKETSSGLEALANAATLGENNTASSSPAPTTKHPRHRPGCTCIVCIQPPSGKGPKHKPTCVCNVCMTVKRRFKTLMMRRKKRQSEREAENARKKRAWGKEEGEVNSGTKWRNDSHPFPENGSRQGNLAVTFPSSLPRMNSFSSNGNRFPPNVTFTGSYPSRARAGGEECLGNKGNIDLNSQPEREDEPGKGTGRVSMVRLVQNASYPLDVYLKQQGLASLICPQQMLFSSMGFTRNIGGGRIDEQLGTQHAVVTSDRPQEEATFAFERAKGDDATASAQSFELLEQKSSAQVSSQSS